MLMIIQFLLFLTLVGFMYFIGNPDTMVKIVTKDNYKRYLNTYTATIIIFYTVYLCTYTFIRNDFNPYSLIFDILVVPTITILAISRLNIYIKNV